MRTTTVPRHYRLRDREVWQERRGYHLHRMWVQTTLLVQPWGTQHRIAGDLRLNAGYLNALLSGKQISNTGLYQVSTWLRSHVAAKSLPPFPRTKEDEQRVGLTAAVERQLRLYEAKRQWLLHAFQERLLPYGSSRTMALAIEQDPNRVSALLHGRYEDASILDAMEAWAKEYLNERTTQGTELRSPGPLDADSGQGLSSR